MTFFGGARDGLAVVIALFVLLLRGGALCTLLGLLASTAIASSRWLRIEILREESSEALLRVIREIKALEEHA
ncbi:MAG: hypothetical protein NVSMB48_23630 [Marmoricola sp.]